MDSKNWSCSWRWISDNADELLLILTVFRHSNSHYSNCWFCFLLQSLNLKQSVVCGLFNFKMIAMFLAMDFWQSKNVQMLLIWHISMLRLIFFHKYRLITSTKVAVEKTSLLSEFWPGTDIDFYFCIGVPVDNRCQKCLWYGILSFLEILFLQNNWIDFFFQGLNLKLSIFLEISVRKKWFYCVKWNLDGTDIRKSAIILDKPGYSNSSFFSAALAPFFHRGVIWYFFA